jgi:cyclase
MRRERVADDIYVFMSDRYAQVSMGAILTDQGVIVIDTFPFPSETREVIEFIGSRTDHEVRYVVNTHHHADHIYGNHLFPHASIIGHSTCRTAMQTLGRRGLARARAENPELAEVELGLPDVTFDRELELHLGDRSLHLMHAPGHTRDSIVIMIEGDKILFTGDLVMPVPYIVWGDWEQFRGSLRFLQDLKPESIVQGHGDILLRGELRQDLIDSLGYLDTIEGHVRDLVARRGAPSELQKIDIESCGKSRIPLDGLVKKLHQANMLYMYRVLSERRDSES